MLAHNPRTPHGNSVADLARSLGPWSFGPPRSGETSGPVAHFTREIPMRAVVWSCDVLASLERHCTPALIVLAGQSNGLPGGLVGRAPGMPTWKFRPSASTPSTGSGSRANHRRRQAGQCISQRAPSLSLASGHSLARVVDRGMARSRYLGRRAACHGRASTTPSTWAAGGVPIVGRRGPLPSCAVWSIRIPFDVEVRAEGNNERAMPKVAARRSRRRARSCGRLGSTRRRAHRRSQGADRRRSSCSCQVRTRPAAGPGALRRSQMWSRWARSSAEPGRGRSRRSPRAATRRTTSMKAWPEVSRILIATVHAADAERLAGRATGDDRRLAWKRSQGCDLTSPGSRAICFGP